MAGADDSVYALVRGRIVSGAYRPGQHLLESVLTDELGVSRSPVRAALRRLTEESLVITEPHRGAFVAQLTRSDIDEVFDLRQILESKAAGLAAIIRSDDEADALFESVRAMEAINETRSPTYRAELLTNNQEFHDLILAAARAPRLVQIVRTLTASSLSLGTFYYYSDEDIARSVAFHRDLAVAILKRHPEVAAALMAAHLGIAHHAFVDRRFGDARA
ncbi:GntR family transcriptional regulator [Cryobacterium aureum]|uniref:GntR family transcriptional regulator n=1 Tax=Cryobacterium aureum TaxID=995037 RepID=UPI000CF49329|nr:GntR family transcriptional regulator [Cryobacterium aureum]